VKGGELAVGITALGFMVALIITVAGRVDVDSIKARHDGELDRACSMAAGNVRATLPWLTPHHSRREAGLLLLGRDAAWAPVCARDRGAGAELRSQIDAALGQPDAPGAVSLATQLVVALENR
jgi:hypothetical protein